MAAEFATHSGAECVGGLRRDEPGGKRSIDTLRERLLDCPVCLPIKEANEVARVRRNFVCRDRRCAAGRVRKQDDASGGAGQRA